MKKQLVPLLPVLVFLSLGSLGCDSSDGDEASVVGSYAAAQVNGSPLPARAFEVILSGSTLFVDLHEGTLLLRADMTYRLELRFLSNSGGLDNNDSGDYTVSGSTVRFFPTGEASGYTGSVRGSTIAATLPGLEGASYTVIFEKQ